jgi:flagellar biogenesis protein FliO
VSELLLMALAMAFACALVGAVAWLFVRGAEQPDRVSPRWIDAHIRDRRDDV